MIFTILFKEFNHQIVDKWNKTEFLNLISDLKSNFTQTLGYLNPPLKTSTLDFFSGPFLLDLQNSKR